MMTEKLKKKKKDSSNYVPSGLDADANFQLMTRNPIMVVPKYNLQEDSNVICRCEDAEW